MEGGEQEVLGLQFLKPHKKVWEVSLRSKNNHVDAILVSFVLVIIFDELCPPYVLSSLH